MRKCNSNFKKKGNTSSAACPQPLPGFNPQPQISAVDEKIEQRLRAVTRPAFVQAAPGKWVPANPRVNLPEFTLARWAPNGDGTYSAIPFTEHMIRFDARLAKMLGFLGQRNTLYRLGVAGFIEMVKVAPHTTLLNLTSYYNHLARCAEDPEFWDEKKPNFKEYKKTF